MMDLAKNAEDAARCLLETAGKAAVQSAAREAINGGAGEGNNNDGNYQETVDAFWRLRSRKGIPAVRDVLWSLSVSTEGV
jgi:hypothetical protein